MDSRALSSDYSNQKGKVGEFQFRLDKFSFVPAKQLQVSAAARPKQLDRSTQFASAWKEGMFLNSSFQ